MANRREDDLAINLTAVVELIRQNEGGAQSGQIAAALKEPPQRTLQRWLKRLVQEGKGPATRYRLSQKTENPVKVSLPPIQLE